MSEPYVGEIRMFAGNFAPAGWAFCAGQLLAISENQTLFQLIGTTYGGDGTTTFGLPDLRGRLPMHQGGGFTLGENGGAESVTLTVSQIPSHTHPMLASTNQALGNTPAGNVTGQVGATQIYRSVAPDAAMSPMGCSSTGGSQPHTNLQPYLCVDFIISLFGVFPTQS